MKIGILQLTQYLDDTVLGFRKRLTAICPQVHYEYLNADGKAEKLPQLAKQLAAQGVNLIFACSTPSAQAALALPQNIPVVYAPVFDPLGAGLAQSLEQPGGKGTGACGMVNPQQKIALFAKLFPQARQLGILYHSDDPNSCLEVQLICRNLPNSIQYDLIPIDTATDLSHLDKQLKSAWDFLFLPTGRLIEENFFTVHYYTQQIKLPVIASQSDCVSAGALAALSASHEELGELCATQAEAILNGSNPGNLPIATPQKPLLYLNALTAKALHIRLQPDLLQAAHEIYDLPN